MGKQKTPYQNTYEMKASLQELTVDFKGCNRQFDWLEVSLVYNKSDKQLTIYDSYNTECAAKRIKNVQLANISETYSVTKTKKC